jgi:hypothetical protein
MKTRKYPGWAYCVYNKTDPSSPSTLHALVGGDDTTSHDEFHQFLQDAGLLKKPQRASYAHGVSADIWEAFCTTYKIEYCQQAVMNSSKIKTWEGGKKESVFLRLGTLGIDPKEQIKNELEGLMMAPKLRSRRFLDARMSLKRTIDKKGVATTATNSPPLSKNNTAATTTAKTTTAENSPPPLSKTKNTVHSDKTAPLGEKTTASIERMSSMPSLSYILSWGETTGSVLVRFGGRSEKGVDRNKLALAIKAMKATLNGCILQDEKIQTPSCASTQQPTVPNLLKRPRIGEEYSTQDTVSSTKRARVAEKDSTQGTSLTTVLSPVSKIIKEVYPRLGARTLENRQSRILTWTDDATPVPPAAPWTDDATPVPPAAPSKTVQRRAEELAYFVNAGASGDAIPAAETIVRMLKRGDMTLVRQNVQRLLQPEENVDKVITDGLIKFIRHHHTKGQRSKDAQNAIDAILTAACFALSGKTTSLRNISSRILGNADAAGKLTRLKNKGLEMIASRVHFAPTERKTRNDAYREEAACCVSDFCHSDESSRLDTESYRCIKVKNPTTALSEPHPLRVWSEVTLDARYASFAHSDIYKQWRLDNGGKTIGLTSFRAHICPCVRDPTSESCVDLIYSQCQEYMASVRNALKYRPSIKHRIELCQCAMHKCARERRAIMELVLDAPDEQTTTIRVEDGILLWEDLLGGRTSELIGATCCKAVEHATLACQEIRNGKAPILIPWKCTHTTTCNDCGVEKKLRLADCPILSESMERMAVSS